MKRYLLALACILPMSLNACGDEEEGLDGIDECGGCGEGLVCDFRTGQCEDACPAVECSAESEAPVCNEEGENVNTQAPTGVCICDENSCGEGEECRPDGFCGQPCDTLGQQGSCNEGDICLTDGYCGAPPVVDCGTVGEQGSCEEEGDVCQLDGSCAPPAEPECSEVGPSDECEIGSVCLASGSCAQACDDDVCLEDSLLCQAKTEEVEDYNTCVDPDLATGCRRSDGLARDEGGPIVLSVSYDPEGDRKDPPTDNSEGCDGNFTVKRFTVELKLIEDDDSLPSAIYTEGVRFVRPNGELGNTFERITETQIPSDDSRYIVTFELCLEDGVDSRELAVVINDDSSEPSNAACFSDL